MYRFCDWDIPVFKHRNNQKTINANDHQQEVHVLSLNILGSIIVVVFSSLISASTPISNGILTVKLVPLPFSAKHLYFTPHK